MPSQGPNTSPQWVHGFPVFGGFAGVPSFSLGGMGQLAGGVLKIKMVRSPKTVCFLLAPLSQSFYPNGP